MFGPTCRELVERASAAQPRARLILNFNAYAAWRAVGLASKSGETGDSRHGYNPFDKSSWAMPSISRYGRQAGGPASRRAADVSFISV
jgi:hypothetical protein